MCCGKCTKILNTSCLLKRTRQTVLTQIRLLLKKKSNQIRVFPVCYSDKHFVNFSPENQYFIKPIFYLRTEKEKCFLKFYNIYRSIF